MDEVVTFVLLCEGASDTTLKEPLEMLCVECGAEEARGEAPDLSRLPNPPGHSVKEKLEYALVEYSGVDIIFVHRDADKAGVQAREREIRGAEREAGLPLTCVPVIPVKALEAWLVVDEQEIRDAVGNPRGRTKLSIPERAREAEHLRDPKKTLENALLQASEKRGRQLERVKSQFGRHRAILARRLSPDGRVNQVPSWEKLRWDTLRSLQGDGDDPRADTGE